MAQSVSSLKWYEKNFVLLIGGLTIVAILILNYFLAHYLEAKNRQIIAWQLEANIQTTIDRLLEWRKLSAGKIEVIAKSNVLNPHFLTLMKDDGDIEKAREQFDETFNNILTPLGFDGYSVFSLDRKLLAATSKEYLGVTAGTPTIIDVLDMALHGTHGISHPVVAVKNIDGPKGPQPVGSLFQMLCTQINDAANNNAMLGYLCVRFNPLTSFFPIFQTGRVGASGEAYAINAEGLLITPSRFSSSRNIAMMDTDISYPVQHIAAREPANTEGGTGNYTKLASKILSTPSRTTLFNYPDYRGVNVVGTGQWLQEFNFGVVVEQDWDEAFQTWIIARNAVYSLSTGAIILIVILCAIFSYNRQIIFLRERRFRSLLKNIPTPVYIKDAEGHFLALNPEFEKFTGIHRDDLLGEKVENLPIPRWLSPIFLNDTTPYSSEENKDGRLIELYSSAGEIKYYKVLRFNIAADSQTHLTSVATILMDTTERILASERLSEINKRLEDLVDRRTHELKNAKEKAEMASRAKAEFLANMSHEIRTPLNTILGLAHVALNTDVNDTVKSFLQKMRASGKHLLNIINDILNFSRLEVGKLELDQRQFTINEVVDSAVNLVKEKAKSKNLEFIVNVDSDIPTTLIGDPLRLSQILINLCVNAVKFTEIGSVMLDVKNLGIHEHRIYLEFSVKDTGIGISRENLNNLFQPFSQVDSSSARKFEGSGLGLAISKSLAELMQATITVQSTPDSGSCFSLKIPLEFSEDKQTISVRAAMEDQPLRKMQPLNCNILLVEDNQLNLEVTQSLLLLMGARVESASTGQQALEKMQKRSYDVVLMDIQMPGMDGVETTRSLRQFDEQTPVIATTANALDGDREWYLANGFNAYLSKPLEPNEIHQTILNILAMAGEDPQANTNQAPLETADKQQLKQFEPLEKAGIDVQKAMTHMMHNSAIYISGLQKFCEQRENFIADLDEFLEHKMFEHASNHVHSLTSLSAMLGLTSISNKARVLEEAFMQNKIEAQTITDLSHELRSTITLVRAWLHTSQESQKLK